MSTSKQLVSSIIFKQVIFLTGNATFSECPCNMDGIKDVRNCHESCECKLNVEGGQCDKCKAGFFNLDSANPFGCLDCYCFGVTNQCSSSSYYRSAIHFNLTESQSMEQHGFELTNRFKTNFYTDRILLNMFHGELYFYSLFWLQNKSVDRETLYWLLPQKYLGNKLTSYGGKLGYKLKYVVQSYGNFITDADVILLGKGIELQYIHAVQLEDNHEQSFAVDLNAEQGRWQKIDRRTQMTGLATRVDFMQALSKLEMIAIRATFHSQMAESYIKDVVLDDAVPYDNGQNRAALVEQCSCPQGYMGSSCEQCTLGYVEQVDQDGKFKCVRCECNSHSNMCDSLTGKCFNCEHNTQGDHCEQCSIGHFGDATQGTNQDCSPCPCPLVDRNNNFSPTCILDNDGQPTCNACQKQYTGRTCEKCSPGYSGDPSIPGGRCVPSSNNNTQSIKVRIDGPKHRRVRAGSTIDLRCTGVSKISQFALNLDWIKLDGQLPSEAIEVSGMLTLPNIQVEHSGTYICTGSDLESVAQSHVTIVVDSDVQTSVPKVKIEPRYQEVYLGDPVTFKCVVDGHPPPELHWAMSNDQRLNPQATFSPETGVFFIPAAQRTDEAEYICKAINSAGSSTVRTVLFVRPRDYHAYNNVEGSIPTAKVSSNSFTASIGENIHLECNVTGQPIPLVKWTFAGSGPHGHLPINSREVGNALVLSHVTDNNSGVYTCTASNLYGTAEAQSRVEIKNEKQNMPAVQVEPARQSIVQGQSGEIRCHVSGEPRPVITWQKVGDELDRNKHKVLNNKLIIENMEMRDRGLYVCRADNKHGVAQGSAVVEIDVREIPSIEIHKSSSQKVTKGSRYF